MDKRKDVLKLRIHCVFYRMAEIINESIQFYLLIKNTKYKGSQRIKCNNENLL